MKSPEETLRNLRTSLGEFCKFTKPEKPFRKTNKLQTSKRQMEIS